ncbi:MAG: FAD binding domain-containing protein [Chloroflexi bacterium]|nr:FAD binding domain-containing protein [Chloroflexota bacterium]
MITEYHRPDTFEEVFSLILRKDPPTVVLGGGLYINEVIKEPIDVVDLQGLGINGIEEKGKNLLLGGMATLQSLLDANPVNPALKEAILHQETYNRRQVATVAGSLVVANGRSVVAGVFLALDAELELTGKDKQVESVLLGDFLPIRKEKLAGKLITKINLPTQTLAAYHYVARSPADLPIVAAAAAQWPSGRTRVVLMGYGDQPRMVLDGPNSTGAEIAARDSYSTAGDQWASAEYRANTAAVLVKRCLTQIAEMAEG